MPVPENLQQVRSEILDGIAEECRPCRFPGVMAYQLGQKVVDGALAINEAQRILNANLAANCGVGPNEIVDEEGERIICQHGTRALG